MNPRTRLFRGLALTALLGIGLTACKEDTLIPPPDPTISAAPSSLRLMVGQSQQIVGSMSDGSNVAFESLNTAVAMVAAGGNTGTVTAVAVGSATIRVSSVERPSLQTAVNVVVTPVEFPASDTADVTIQGVFQAQTISPVDPDSVVNTIDITMGVDRGDADKLTVYVNGEAVPACTQTFTFGAAAITAEGLSIGAAPTSVVCSLDTRAFNRGTTAADSLSGIPMYPNGMLDIHAELTKEGTLLSAATRNGFTLANSDFMQAYIATHQNGELRGSVIGDTGLQWFGNGDLRVVLVPVIFSAADQGSSGYPARVDLNFDGYVAGNDETASNAVTERTAGGFVVEFPRSGGGGANIAGFNTGREGTRINVASTTNGGQPGPATVYSPFTGNPTANNRVHFTELQSGTALLNSILRLDNEAPQAGRLILPAHPQVNRVWARNGWVNDAVNFFTAKDGSHDAPFEYGGGSVGAAYTGTAPATSYTSVYGSIPALGGFDPIHGVGQDSIVIYASHVGGDNILRLGARQGSTGGVASSADLTATLTNSEWSVFATVWDRLGNSSNISITRADPVVSTIDFPTTAQTGDAALIGVDLTPPDVSLQLSDTLMTRYNPVDETVSAQGIDGSLDPQQGPSGIAVTQLLLRSYACPAAVLECAPADDSDESVTPLTTPGLASTGNAITEQIGAVVGTFTRAVNDVTANRYHNYLGQIFDRAGNESLIPASMVFIRDTEVGGGAFPTSIVPVPPTVSNVNIPPVPRFSGGTAYPFAATISDNVDLRRATVGLDFDGDFRVPFVTIPQTVWGPSHIIESKLVEQEMPYVRSLSAMIGPDTATAPVLPTKARFVAFDHSSPLGAISTQANNIVPNTRDTLFVPWFDTDPSPNAGIMIAPMDSLTWLVGGQTGTFANPFSRVLFYVYLDGIDDGSGRDMNYLIGEAGAPQVQDGYLTIYRVYRFTAPPIPQEIIDWGGDYTVFAIGISSNGDALASEAGHSTLP